MEMEPHELPLQLIGGNGNIQIHNLTIVVNDPPDTKTRLTSMQLAALIKLIDEVAAAESHRIDAEIIQTALLDHLKVSDIKSLESAQYRRAELYLTGWANCARNSQLSNKAIVAQILRIWRIAPPLKQVVCDFSRTNFDISKLDGLSEWALRCVFNFTMHRWCQYWITEDQ